MIQVVLLKHIITSTNTLLMVRANFDSKNSLKVIFFMTLQSQKPMLERVKEKNSYRTQAQFLGGWSCLLSSVDCRVPYQKAAKGSGQSAAAAA